MPVALHRRRLLHRAGAFALAIIGSAVVRPGFGFAAVSDKKLAEPPPEGATTVRVGELRDGDPVHRGSGTALILRLPDGSTMVRLEGIEIVPGPNLLVYLAGHEDPLFPEDVTAGFTNLGRLKSLLGDQNYKIPADVDHKDFGSVVVWCDTFQVQFAVAAME